METARTVAKRSHTLSQGITEKYSGGLGWNLNSTVITPATVVLYKIYQRKSKVLIISITLAIGTIAVLCFKALAGRLAAFSVIALWSAATSYFFMTPLYSLRVANRRDLNGIDPVRNHRIVLTDASANRRYRKASQALEISPPLPAVVDFENILSDLIQSSEIGERLRTAAN